MLKVAMSMFGRDMEDSIRDGASSMLMHHQRNQLLVLTESSDSTLTDHSFFNQDFQWAESLKLSVAETL